LRQDIISAGSPKSQSTGVKTEHIFEKCHTKTPDQVIAISSIVQVEIKWAYVAILQ
jgi:hypothetical protein